MPASTPTFKTSPRFGILNVVKDFENAVIAAGSTISLANLILLDTQVRAFQTAGSWPVGRGFASEAVTHYKNIVDNSGVFSAKEICNKSIFVSNISRSTVRSRLKYFVWLNTGDLTSTRCPLIYDVGAAIATNGNFVAGDATANGLNSAATNKWLRPEYTNAAEIAAGGSSRGFRLYSLPPFDVSTGYIYNFNNAGGTSYDNAYTTATPNASRFQFSNAFSTTSYASIAANKNYNFVRSATNRTDLYEDASSVANSTSSITLPDASTTGSSHIFSANASNYAKCTMVYFFAGLKMTATEVATLNTEINGYLTRMA